MHLSIDSVDAANRTPLLTTVGAVVVTCGKATGTSMEGVAEALVTTGGGGGTKTRGGYGGNSNVFDWVQPGSARQGAMTSPPDGEVSIPVVLEGTG